VIRLFANAKVNLALDITGVREDGYHLMDMLNRSAGLSDILTIRKSEGKEHVLLVDGSEVSDPSSNLVMKAVREIEKMTGGAIRPLELDLTKNIPAQAGLGGGSADAAAALIGVSELLNLRLTGEELQRAAGKLGADIPFCLTGGAARVTGIGETVRPVPDNCAYSFVILMPDGGKSTAEAFREADSRILRHPDICRAERCLTRGDLEGLAQSLDNAFFDREKDALTASLIAQLLQGGALGASLTGSGAAVFGLFSDREEARACAGRCRKEGMRAWACEPAASGVAVDPV